MPKKKELIAVVGATGAQGGGLVRAILADRDGPFAVRAITRKPDSEKARALAAKGVEVVKADADDPASLERAFAGAHGVYAMTSYWEYLSVEREQKQARNLARATRKAGAKHVIWSTLEDTRLSIPLADTRLPTLQGKYKVPHFDGKGEMDTVFASEAAPTSYLLIAFYWENFIQFGQGPHKTESGDLMLSLPLAGGKLPGIAAEDIGRCALGIFKRGAKAAGQRFGIAGDQRTGEQYAEAFSRALDRKVVFRDMSFDAYRAQGFPGADDMGNMYQHHSILGPEFLKARDPKVARELDPSVQDFETWLAKNVASVPVG